MPETLPKTSERNFTPTSTGDVSPASGTDGVTVLPQIEQGQETATEAPAPGVWVFPLSSVARVLIMVVGWPCAVHVYVQFAVPVAGCQVVPPSVETSTPATTPPPASD